MSSTPLSLRSKATRPSRKEVPFHHSRQQEWTINIDASVVLEKVSKNLHSLPQEIGILPTSSSGWTFSKAL